MQNGTHANVLPWTPLAAGSEISTAGATYSDAFEAGDRGTVRLTQTTSATGGTSPTLDIKVQTSHDNVTYRDLHEGAFTQITDVGSEQKSVGGCDRFVRLCYTLGGSGTPTVTLGIDGEFC
jgi:hypothetical protein